LELEVKHAGEAKPAGKACGEDRSDFPHYHVPIANEAVEGEIQ
jgi:hypothetical protein